MRLAGSEKSQYCATLSKKLRGPECAPAPSSGLKRIGGDFYHVHPRRGYVQLIADEIAIDDRGNAVDFATSGERVSIVVSTAGGPTEQARWAERCTWFAWVAHPSLAKRSMHGCRPDPTLRSVGRAAALARCRNSGGAGAAARISISPREWPLRWRTGPYNGRLSWWAERSCCPMPRRVCRSIPLRGGRCGSGPGAARCPAPPRLTARRACGHFQCDGLGRLPALALGRPTVAACRLRYARCMDRATGRNVPVSAALIGDDVRALRTLALFAHDDIDGGWRGRSTRRSGPFPHRHFQGPRRCRVCTPRRRTEKHREALQASFRLPRMLCP